jgi:predicted RecB family nuclease
MIITQEVFEAFLHCPTKSHLVSQPEVPDARHIQERPPGEESYQQSGSSRLRASVPDHEVYTGTPTAETIKRKTYQIILGYTALASDLRAHIHGLELVHVPGAKGLSVDQYVPIRFISAEKVPADHRLLLAFDAIVFSQAVSTPLPHIGKLIHGRSYSTTAVVLTPLYTKVRSAIAAIGAQQASPTPPPLVLNKHCPQCQYAPRCRQIATEADDLSLLAKLSAKERQGYHEKGIFTVKQLSYTFRPRRRIGNHRKHEHALQALAIRKNQIHVIGPLAFTTEGTLVYLDVEGDPDRDLYYCIGLRFEDGGVTVQRSYWADSPSDEGAMWAECLRTLAGIDTPRLVHYGAYETTFLRQMGKRYPNAEWTVLLDRLIGSAVNLLSTIYARVYFPTYSNGLKDVARYLGFRWSHPAASGLVALAWRREWEFSRRPDLKERLITYNAEDCAAAQTVAENLVTLSRSSPPGATNVVDVATLRREYPQRLGKTDFALPEFKQINDAARWDHQREKVYARTNKRLARVDRNASTERWTVPINRVVECEEQRPARCTACGATLIYRWGRLSRTVFDFKLSGAGVKRWVVRYSFPRYICWQCKATFHQYAHQTKYGNTMCAYTVYQIIDLRLTQNAVAKSMRQIFGIPASRGMVNRLKASVAEHCEEMYQAILDKIVAGALVHADETGATVAGKDAYVWVFANLEEVAFVYSENREAVTAQKVLRQFGGVLVSDFYAGYDSISCTQQKCLIHLMRDINDDLYKQPFNDEMKEIGTLFGEVLRPIIESVDRFGLKARYLRKHQPAVNKFYQTLSRQDYQTAVAVGYVRRFEKNRDRLFTFLDHDGIPWNNNNAEHAIKAFVRLRNVIGGTSTAKGLREYLVLLSVCETCKCKGVSFLDFLLSEEASVDAFISKRGQRVVSAE